jgi:diacylglycerol kinase
MRSRSLAESFRFAFLGLGYALRTQRNMRIHFLIALVVLLAAGFTRVGVSEMALLALAISSVIVAETVNTAIEVLVDLVSPDYNPLAGTAKNLAAAAVVVATFFAIMVGLLVFGPIVFRLLAHAANHG